ncbi:uncharacterized protein BXZ73DRAFT_76669 [Epithele typhae]|uniref:uncharacterized protein n=1 Tax=Epithele typhae TaxID=378194 RepID=UPI002008251E|nr:uncharacterized protein BXZ73DRAFT_76669 [Epithele typhae]KAH9936879.1 hypothetical protein BXZ73DRAFT_76669 [Epithele typhae]
MAIGIRPASFASETTPLAPDRRASYATTSSSTTSISTASTSTAGSCRRGFRIKPLKYCHARRAAKAAYSALRHDTASHYFKAADDPLVYELREISGLTLNFADAVYRRKALTIGRGDAVIIYGVPGTSNSGPLLPKFSPLLRMTFSDELAERKREFFDMLRPMLESALGPRVHQMLEIQSLSTAPSKQGRGYGTALVQVVNDLADSLGRAVYVVTTDAYRFYEKCGYTLVGEVFIGDGNPAWHGPPAPIRLMLREPKAVAPRAAPESGSRKPCGTRR